MFRGTIECQLLGSQSEGGPLPSRPACDHPRSISEKQGTGLHNFGVIKQDLHSNSLNY